MSIILNCDKCGKQMGSLEPHTIKDEKYLCKPCADTPPKTIKDGVSEDGAPNVNVDGILGIPDCDIFLMVNGVNLTISAVDLEGNTIGTPITINCTTGAIEATAAVTMGVITTKDNTGREAAISIGNYE